MNELIIAFQNLAFFITGVWDVMTSNLLLCVPLAFAVIWYAMDILKSIFNILKKGG